MKNRNRGTIYVQTNTVPFHCNKSSYVAAVIVVQLCSGESVVESWFDLSCAVAVCQTSSLFMGLD